MGGAVFPSCYLVGLVDKSCPTLEILWTVACQAPPSMGFSSQNTGVGCHFLLQGIFLTQKSNPGLLHCRRILYQLSQKGITLLIYIYLVVCIVHWPHQLKFHVLLFSEALGHNTVPGTEQKSRKKELICAIEQMAFLFSELYFFMCKRKGLDHFRLFQKLKLVEQFLFLFFKRHHT